MYPLVEPRQRPERFLLNRFSPLAESAAFLGLGGFDAAGSVWYPDARRLLGAVPNDGTLTNMDPATDWVWSPELGRWVTAFGGIPQHIAASYASALDFAGNKPFSVSLWTQIDTTANRAVIGHGIGTRNGQWSILASDALYFVVTDSATSKFLYRSTPKSSALQYVTATYSGSASHTGLGLYINGVPVGTTGSTGTFNAMQSTADPLTIGKAPMIQFASGYLIGTVADPIILGRVLSPGEISALADPSNVMLEVGGVPLILPPRRQAFPAAVAEEPSGFKPYWARPSYQIIGGGIA